jgi:hypothetical protein
MTVQLYGRTRTTVRRASLIISKALMCRGPIEYEDRSAIGMCLLEDFDCDLDLIGQLREIPPRIKAFSGVGNLSGFKCREMLLVQ